MNLFDLWKNCYFDVCGEKLPADILLEYLAHVAKLDLEGGVDNFITFEYMRQKLHDNVFKAVGLDGRLDDDNEKGERLHDLVCDATVCPFHNQTLNNNMECFELRCDFKVKNYRDYYAMVYENLKGQVKNNNDEK